MIRESERERDANVTVRIEITNFPEEETEIILEHRVSVRETEKESERMQTNE